jgi:hypothetical protein
MLIERRWRPPRKYGGLPGDKGITTNGDDEGSVAPWGSNGATREETVGITNVWSRNRRLAVRRRGLQKKRYQGVGGSRQKSGAAHGRLIRRVVPALHKGRGRRGPGNTPGNRIRGRSRIQELCLGSKETIYETLGQTSRLEVVKRADGSSIGLRTLWRSRTSQKRKKILLAVCVPEL